MPFAAIWMDQEIITLSEVNQTNTMWYHLYVESKIWHKYIEWSQTEKEKYHMTSRIGGIYKEMIQMNLFTKQKQTHRLQEGAYGCQVVGERWEEGIVRELGMGMYTRLYLKWITFWRAHGTLLSVMWQTGWEGGFRENRYMDMYDGIPSRLTWNYHNTVY